MTIFSKIIQNPEKYDAQVLEINENFMIMLSLHPVTKGHALVIPLEEADDLSNYLFGGSMIYESIKWADIITSKLGAPAYTLKINNKLYTLEDTGHVNHLHMHVIPRYSAKDKIDGIPMEESKEILMKVKKLILAK